MQILCNANLLSKFCVMQNLPGQVLSTGHLGAILRPSLGPSWGYLRPVLEPPWAILGLSWGHLGLSWCYFNLHFASCRSQSRFVLKHLVRSCEMLVFGILPPWLFPELLLENPWGHLGPSWAIWKPPWSHVGPILGRSWAHLGPILGLPGAILAEFTQNLLGQILCTP